MNLNCAWVIFVTVKEGSEVSVVRHFAQFDGERDGVVARRDTARAITEVVCTVIADEEGSLELVLLCVPNHALRHAWAGLHASESRHSGASLPRLLALGLVLVASSVGHPCLVVVGKCPK